MVVIALIPLGRWEQHRAVARDQERILSIAALAGPPESSRVAAYRLSFFDCLDYVVGKNPFAIELCYDTHGELVEAIDRRHYGYDPKIGSVRYDPSKAPVTVPPARLLAAFQRVGALRGMTLQQGALPGPFDDGPPALAVRKKRPK